MGVKKSRGFCVTAPAQTPGPGPGKYWRNTPFPDPEELLRELRARYSDPQERLKFLEDSYIHSFALTVTYFDMVHEAECKMFASEAGQKWGGNTTQRKAQQHQALVAQAWKETNQGSYPQAHERYRELCTEKGLIPWKSTRYFNHKLTEHCKRLKPSA
jgi:hypothetical protein